MDLLSSQMHIRHSMCCYSIDFAFHSKTVSLKVRRHIDTLQPSFHVERCTCGLTSKITRQHTASNVFYWKFYSPNFYRNSWDGKNRSANWEWSTLEEVHCVALHGRIVTSFTRTKLLPRYCETARLRTVARCVGVFRNTPRRVSKTYKSFNKKYCFCTKNLINMAYKDIKNDQYFSNKKK